MATKVKTAGVLSAFTLKILACIFMLIDHLGVTVFPSVTLFRIIGRLAYPIFAYFIAEGCYYTKNRLKRFLSVFLLGVLCETVYIIYDGRYYGNILLAFSLSILLIYCLQEIKKNIFYKNWAKTTVFAVLFVALLTSTYIISTNFGIDYGFFGVLTPVLVSLFDYKIGETPERFKKYDTKLTKLALFALGLTLVALRPNAMDIQFFSLLTIPLLALYNGKVGRYKLKYFFYLFYPLHLLLVQAIALLVR